MEVTQQTAKDHLLVDLLNAINVHHLQSNFNILLQLALLHWRTGSSCNVLVHWPSTDLV